MSVNSKMTALADEVRGLSGATDKLGIDAMTTHVQNANGEIESQTTLLSQAIAALEGKTAAGGGSATPVLQNKTVTPITSSQTVTPDSGYDGLARVTVNAIPSNYEDVTDETAIYTTSLTDLESVINSLPDAGGGSGGSVETCTVTLNINGFPAYYALATVYSDTIGNWIKIGIANNSTYTVENVVVGSVICVAASTTYLGGGLMSIVTTGSVAQQSSATCGEMFIVNGDGTITMTYD